MFGESGMPEPPSIGDAKGLHAESMASRPRNLKVSRSGSFGELGRLVWNACQPAPLAVFVSCFALQLLCHLMTLSSCAAAAQKLEYGTVLQQSYENGCAQAHSKPEQSARITGL